MTEAQVLLNVSVILSFYSKGIIPSLLGMWQSLHQRQILQYIYLLVTDERSTCCSSCLQLVGIN